MQTICVEEQVITLLIGNCFSVIMTEMCDLGGVVILCTVTTAILSMERAERCLNGLCRSILMRRICTHQKSPSIYGHVNKRGEMRGR